MANKKPNPAHTALAQWQYHSQSNNQRLTLITQNVDDLHEQAGSTVTHLHGHLWRNKCSHCESPYHSQPNRAYDREDGINLDDNLVSCEDCDGYIRPDIVWFGESLPVQAWQTAEEAAADCEVFISIGTSSLVYPAAGLAQLAKQNGAAVIEVNPHPTPNTLVDITLAEKAGVILPELIKKMGIL